MTYTFIKAKGRVAFIKDGEFNHQQFRGHWAYNNPEAYIARMIEQDAEAAEYAAEERAARKQAVAAYIAQRADRVAAQPTFAF